MTITHIPAGPWNDEPELWDRIEIGGKLCPGLAKVEIDRANKFDDKKSKGKSGAKRELAGVDPAKVTIEIRIWTKEDYEEFEREILPIVEPNTEKEKLEPYKISHRAAITRKVSEMTTDHVKGPTMVETHIYAFNIDGEEHRPPSAKNATGTMKGGGLGPISGTCADLTFQLNILYAQQIEAKGRQDKLKFQRDAGEYDPSGITGPDLASLNAQIDSLEADRNEIARRTVSILEQQNAMGCNGAPPGGPKSF